MSKRAVRVRVWSAICPDCTYQSPWTEDRAEADDARLAHEDVHPVHRPDVIASRRTVIR